MFSKQPNSGNSNSPGMAQARGPGQAGAQRSSSGNSSSTSSATPPSAFTPPSITLPKGGGAIRGIGEKFAANPVTGTGSMTVPIATSPGRSGFGPQLSLSYDSGAGNGPFGLGWNLSLPSITRKTDKGLPKYQDADESDVFILSGAEDLVPVLIQNPQEKWVRESILPRTVNRQSYQIDRYRPRIEGLFARIERWTNHSDPKDTFWRSISKDNITTWYGKTEESRIVDPSDSTRIFSWLICESYDDKGNAIAYQYKEENSDDIDVSQAHERNRNPDTRKANRYLKRIRYGNHKPYFPKLLATAPWPDLPPDDQWYFEVVFDYGEHDLAIPMPERGPTSWPCRNDPFSSYRAGFEVRTYRLCQRVLMFHHFPNEAEVIANCLVRSTDFEYSYERDPQNARNPIFSTLLSVTQSGYKRRPTGGYLKKSMPPVEFTYSQPEVSQAIQVVNPESLENLPYGVDGSNYQWVDLDAEGTPGILTEQGEGWFYKRNWSPATHQHENGKAKTQTWLAPLERVAAKPSLAAVSQGQQQFLDLAGDGQVDLVQMDGSVRGFYERTHDEDWEPFRPFQSWPNVNTGDPNLKFVDLTGDGHADILITEHEAFVWHQSLAEDGFDPATRVAQAIDEEQGPRVVFADGTQSVYLSDISGDGLTDLVRIRNGEVCYWPNLGYGRFGPKVTMDNAPWFDTPDLFDQRRIRLADIDGSGVTDIIYLGNQGVQLYYNQSGNSWSQAQPIRNFPHLDNVASIYVTDLLGNGTACLVWSSPLLGDSQNPMRCLDLMGGEKPHLLTVTTNNLGAETKIQYAPSTKFYVKDKLAGRPWITKLPFPVQVVERVETYDHISRNRFVTHYAYHHGYFDGTEREFRGFGMVEQWDTEEFEAFRKSSLAAAGEEGQGEGAIPTNLNKASHVPPILSKTWFHTGVYRGREHVSNFFAGLLDANDLGDYYREPGLDDTEATTLGLDEHARRLFDDAIAKERLLIDTILPPELTVEEEREACRALRGSMLRQEVYAIDGTDQEPHPYTVTEQNFTIRRLQPKAGNRHAVFFTHAREAISYHYERKLVPILNGQIVDERTAEANLSTQWKADPRVQHALTLEVDEFGNVQKEAAIGYGRRYEDSTLPLAVDRKKQTEILITYTENEVTNDVREDDAYRTPLPAETRTYQLTGYTPSGNAGRFQPADFVGPNLNDPNKLIHLFDEEINYEEDHAIAKQRRLIEHVRTLYRNDKLSGLLSLKKLQSLALPGETYKLAFTPGLLDQVYLRNGQKLLPNPAKVLPIDIPTRKVKDRGGYVDSQSLKNQNLFPKNQNAPLWSSSDKNGHWWIPSGRIFLSPNTNDNAAKELTYALQHFFLPHRYRDPFHVHNVHPTESFVTYDDYKLLLLETRDALDNRVTVGERDTARTLTKTGNDYRVLQPRLVMDPNRNRTAVAFDALGMVVGTAVMGKPEDNPQQGDKLEVSFNTDLSNAEIDAFYDVNDPHGPAPNYLKTATTRIVYDMDRFYNARQSFPQEPEKWQPVFAAALARETHDSDLKRGEQTKIQISFSYSDGFGREIQKKIQAKPGKVPKRDATSKIIVGPNRQPEMTANLVNPRWVGSGWTIFNNKGKPVRQFEPFFTDRHQFEFDVQIGVSPYVFYDPLERVVATLHPNHTYEKVVFDPWRQETWDVNDTVTLELQQDDYVKGFFLNPDGTSRLPTDDFTPTWHQLRTNPAHAPELSRRWPDQNSRNAEVMAAQKAAAHEKTPTIAHFDTLGRPFLTIAHNRFERNNIVVDEKYPTRVLLDIEGNQREVRDAVEQNGDKQGRIVMRYGYDMLGNRIHQASMEAGERWMLNDVAGNPIRAWDSRGHNFWTEYDRLRRPLHQFAHGTDGNASDRRILNRNILFEKTEYGEGQPNDSELNLRTQVFKQYDGAGGITNMAKNPATDKHEAYDFKGNLLGSTRQLAQDYKGVVNWSSPRNPLDPGNIFQTSTTYDALNRPMAVVSPDGSVYRPTYSEANLLNTVDVNLHGEQVNGQPKWTPFVTNIDYDAKGQRKQIDYATKDGKRISTRYTYDSETFRLIHLVTRRPNHPEQNKRKLQDLSYTYDPAGNITHIRDDAQQTIYFKNKRVEPNNDYTYDALYRLIQASGREHLGQQGNGDRNPPTPPDAFNTFHTHPDDPGNGNAMGTYIERYVYDAVGNFLEMQHRGSDPVHPGWTRAYAYGETSLIEDGTGGTLLKTSNRLSSTTVKNGNPITERYLHDAHGNILQMPHLVNHLDPADPNMHWDFQDQLRQTDLGGGGTAYYVYDASGERVRKVREKNGGTLIEERIYLGGFEIFRRRQGRDLLERETLHIMDDKQRIALVEIRTRGNEPGVPKQLIRFQFGNHLGSASLELDYEGEIISYEEYFPYGSTSYQAVRSQTETPKRYRYTGKERDEESGLYYFGARYYAPWLGRWTSCDPEGLVDGENLYEYVRGNPIRLIDTSGTLATDFEQLKTTSTSGTAGTRFDLDPQVVAEHDKRFRQEQIEERKKTISFAKRSIKVLSQEGAKNFGRLVDEVEQLEKLEGRIGAPSPVTLEGNPTFRVMNSREEKESDLNTFFFIVGLLTPGPPAPAKSAGRTRLGGPRGNLRPQIKGPGRSVRQRAPHRSFRKNSTRGGSPVQILESGGAGPKGSSVQSASGQTPRSMNTAIRADVAEAEAYKAALLRGEIGLQRPLKANGGGSDFISAARDTHGAMEIIVTDVKMSSVGRFPKPESTVKPSWMAEAQSAVAPNRLNLNNQALEQEVRGAFAAGRVRLRQLNADYSATGQGRITGF